MNMWVGRHDCIKILGILLNKECTQFMCHESAHIFLDFTDGCSENISQLGFRPISVFLCNPYGVRRRL